MLPLARGKGNWGMTNEEINKNFLPTFQTRSKNMYSTEDALEGSLKKNFQFTGKEKNIETLLSFAGGFGAGFLPKANNSTVDNQRIVAKKVYQRALVDREGLKAASDSVGSYRQYLKWPVKKAVEGYVNQCGRINFGDGSGILGRGDGATQVSGNGSEASPYIVTLRASDFKDVNFHRRALVQMVSGLNVGDNLGGAMEGGTSSALPNLLEVVKVEPKTRKIHLTGVSPILAALTGVGPLLTTTGIAHQRSYLNEPTGLGSVLMATTGQLYGIDVQTEWQAGQLDAGGLGIITDMINEAMLERGHVFGEEPNMILCHYKQYQKILAQLEDQKRIMIKNRNVKGHMGFEGIEYVGQSGKPIALVTNRHADADKVYLLNTNYFDRLHRPDFGWFDEDGTVFMRTQDEDEYEARYGGYWENAIVPTAQAVIYNLAL